MVIIKKPLTFKALKTLCFIVVSLLVTSSCSKEKPEEEEEIVYYDYFFDGKKIEAKVHNASKFKNIVEVVILLYDGINKRLIARGGIWNDDGFTILLPETVNQNFLVPILQSRISPYFFGYPPCPEVTFSNLDVNVFDLWDISGVDKDGIVLAHFSPRGYRSLPFYTYVDSDVNIYGTLRRTSWIDSYSVQWKKGWNFTWHPSYGTSHPKIDISEYITMYDSIKMIWIGEKSQFYININE